MEATHKGLHFHLVKKRLAMPPSSMNISLSFACGAVAALVALESFRSPGGGDERWTIEEEEDGGDWVRVVTTPLTAAPLIARVRAQGRRHRDLQRRDARQFEGQEVVRLEYEASPMAEREMAKICAEARRRWPDLTRVAMARRLGVCPCRRRA